MSETWLIATRSSHKAAEIERILARTRVPRLVTLRDLGVAETSEEDPLENGDTFLANAIAKARYFSRLTRMTVLADDSGLEVRALDNRPGVRTRRFALDAGFDVSGAALDHANNELLLQRLKDIPLDARQARYVCAAAQVRTNGSVVASIGTCSGLIALTPAGSSGFGYDPIFYIPDLERTFAQLTPDQKDARSHRARAFRALATALH